MWFVRRVAGGGGAHEINHNDEYDWCYESSCVVDTSQQLYQQRGAALTGSGCDVDTGRCCSAAAVTRRRHDDSPGGATGIVAAFTQPPCAFIKLYYSMLSLSLSLSLSVCLSAGAYLIYSVFLRFHAAGPHVSVGLFLVGRRT